MSSGTKASDGTIALAGIKEQDAWIVKLDAECSLEWEKTYTDTLVNSVLSIVEAPDQGFIAVGKKSIMSDILLVSFIGLKPPTLSWENFIKLLRVIIWP